MANHAQSLSSSTSDSEAKFHRMLEDYKETVRQRYNLPVQLMGRRASAQGKPTRKTYSGR